MKNKSFNCKPAEYACSPDGCMSKLTAYGSVRSRARIASGTGVRRTGTAMRVFALALTAAFLALPLTACGGDMLDYTPKPAPSASPEVTPDASTAPDTASPEAAAPYKGDGSAYVNIMTDEYNKTREDQIVLFADTLLDPENGHPSLADSEVSVHTFDSAEGCTDGSMKFFDYELRERFIELINEAILNLTRLSDTQLCFELCRAYALVDTQCSGEPYWLVEEDNMTFPIKLMPLYIGDAPEIFVIAANDARFLMKCVDSINGVPMEDILVKESELIGRSDGSESEILHNAMYGGLITTRAMLEYIGVIGKGEETARFAFRDPETGETLEKELTCVEGAHDPSFKERVTGGEAGMTSASRNFADNSKGRTLSKFGNDGKLMYLVLNCDESVSEELAEIVEKANANAKLEKLVVDFRNYDTNGIESVPEIIAALNSINAPKGKYIVIDHTTGACGAGVAAALGRYVEGAELIGAPTGGRPLAFKMNFVQLEELKFIMPYGSGEAWVFDTDSINEPVRPDEYVYQTAEDYKNGYDSVMKAIIGGE